MSEFRQKTQQQPVTVSAPSSSFPSSTTLINAAKKALTEDKAILLDYWQSSLEKKAFIGVKPNGEKMLVKSSEEYTSTISKIFKSENDIIIITENSIYIVSINIPSKKINSD
jgi:hypothetical protein